MSNLWTIPDVKEELTHLAALHQKRPASPVVQGMAATWCGKVEAVTSWTSHGILELINHIDSLSLPDDMKAKLHECLEKLTIGSSQALKEAHAPAIAWLNRGAPRPTQAPPSETEPTQEPRGQLKGRRLTQPLGGRHRSPVADTAPCGGRRRSPAAAKPWSPAVRHRSPAADSSAAVRHIRHSPSAADTALGAGRQAHPAEAETPTPLADSPRPTQSWFQKHIFAMAAYLPCYNGHELQHKDFDLKELKVGTPVMPHLTSVSIPPSPGSFRPPSEDSDARFELLGETLQRLIYQVQRQEDRQLAQHQQIVRFEGTLQGLQEDRETMGFFTSAARLQTLEKGQTAVAAGAQRAMQLAMKAAEAQQTMSDRQDEVSVEALTFWLHLLSPVAGKSIRLTDEVSLSLESGRLRIPAVLQRGFMQPVVQWLADQREKEERLPIPGNVSGSLDFATWSTIQSAALLVEQRSTILRPQNEDNFLSLAEGRESNSKRDPASVHMVLSGTMTGKHKDLQSGIDAIDSQVQPGLGERLSVDLSGLNYYQVALASTEWRLGLALSSWTVPTMPPMPCLPDEQTAVIESEMVEDAFTKVGLRAASASDQRLWQEKLSWERKCACKKWCTLALMKLSAWAIGRSVASSSGMQLARGSLVESVVDALAGKATATLHGRAGPLLKYAKFWRDRGLDFFPVQEDMVYQYLKAQSNWAPTAPRSLLISLSFAFHILGLSGGDVASKSGRIKGVSDAHYADRRKLVQRPPLTADQILMLEKTVHDTARTSYDRIASGFFLVLIYGRLRYSDGLQLVDLQLDIKETEFGITGFLEARAERTKTSVTLERKIRFLPVAIPVEALMDVSWIPVWLELRTMTLSRIPARAGGQQARKMQTRTKKKLQFLSWSENGLRQELREKANSTPGTEFRDAFTPSLMKVALLSHVADQMSQGGTPVKETPTNQTGYNHEQPHKRAKTGPKGKGQGKVQATPFQRVPTELLKLGAVGSTPKGHRLCFGYNLKTCQAPVAGQKCEPMDDEHKSDDTEAGAGRKRRSELGQCSSTKLQACAEGGASSHKQWGDAPNLHSSQADPVDGAEAKPMSKPWGNDAGAVNSDSIFGSSTGYKDTPIFIEACAGCGILSSVVQQRGFQVIPIDCPRNRHVPKCRLVVLDLTSAYADQLLRRIVRDHKVAGVHIALPCGTCSKARGIPMADGTPGPPPLRDSTHLHGLPGLTPDQQLKVTAANELYACADQFIQFLHEQGDENGEKYLKLSATNFTINQLICGKADRNASLPGGPKMQELKNMRNEKLKDPPVEDTDEAPAKRRRGVECVVEQMADVMVKLEAKMLCAVFRFLLPGCLEETTSRTYKKRAAKEDKKED
ncbi:unnamed protein product [Cladocopium goreaui]|uniref:Tyr recombinase domain-containing protein n=1 Tax=Cladocopium goreaui TaxID=2562237 RepID=A0A9P1GLY6_9DINO|nr:unnamed protein product [Cladocopium goreaui]